MMKHQNAMWGQDNDWQRSSDINSRCSLKKILLLDSDRKYIKQFQNAAIDFNIKSICSYSISEFSLSLKEYRDQFYCVIVDSSFLQDMAKRSIFNHINTNLFVVIGKNPNSSNEINYIPTLNPRFVYKKQDASDLLYKIVNNMEIFYEPKKNEIKIIN